MRREPKTVCGPRYSIIPGDFACDPRAKLQHFRVINLIGRHTDKYGWCRLKQITIGDQVGLTRETVNRKLKDLVAWGYVEKRSDDASGRSIYYRTIMDRGEIPDAADDVREDETDNDPKQRDLQEQHTSQRRVNDGSHVGYNLPEASGNDGEQITPDVSAVDHIRCDRTQSHNNDPSLTIFSNDPPPQPPARGGRERAKRISKRNVRRGIEIDEAIVDALAERPSDAKRTFAIAALLGPIVRQRFLDAPSLAGALSALADWIAERDLSAAEAKRVVDEVLRTRKATVKSSDIETQIKLAVDRRPERQVLSGAADLMARWPDVKTGLRGLLQADIVDQCFSTLVLDKIDERGVAHVATHRDWVTNHVSGKYSAQLRLALSGVFESVRSVSITTRRAAT